VHWIVHVDARGEHSLRYRCKNVNLVEKTVKGVEDEMEFLFVPCVLCFLAFLYART
jgi:hypothetical protein